jgi:hypothetical protein
VWPHRSYPFVYGSVWSSSRLLPHGTVYVH